MLRGKWQRLVPFPLQMQESFILSLIIKWVLDSILGTDSILRSGLAMYPASRVTSGGKFRDENHWENMVIS